MIEVEIDYITPVTVLSGLYVSSTNSGHKSRIDSIQEICDELNITLGQFFADDNTLELTDRDKTILELTQDLDEKKYMRLLAYIEGLHTK